MTGLPKQPTCLSIGMGISLFVLFFLAFFRIPDIVKYAGAGLMYVPAKMGLINMVEPQDVIPMALAENPSLVTIPSPGRYIMYINDYDLLVVHDAVVEGNSHPLDKYPIRESRYRSCGYANWAGIGLVRYPFRARAASHQL